MKAWLIIFALCLPAAAQNSLNEASSVSPTNDTSVNTANETRSVVIVSRSPGVDSQEPETVLQLSIASLTHGWAETLTANM